MSSVASTARISRSLPRQLMNTNTSTGKNDHTINGQLICDADASIMNCVVRWPGSVHDARILRESAVFPMFETMPRPLEGFILGDSGYMLKDWLLTPFIRVANAEQQRYNDSHCATRCIIERCNGILKRRWHCLHTGLRYTHSFYSKLFTVSWVVFYLMHVISWNTGHNKSCIKELYLMKM